MVGTPEWILSLLKTMYGKAKSKVRIPNEFCDDIPVNIGVPNLRFGIECTFANYCIGNTFTNKIE